eukprot:scaffold1235_cov163-Skeletonema_marinoi.AAC.1
MSHLLLLLFHSADSILLPRQMPCRDIPTLRCWIENKAISLGIIEIERKGQAFATTTNQMSFVINLRQNYCTAFHKRANMLWNILCRILGKSEKRKDALDYDTRTACDMLSQGYDCGTVPDTVPTVILP